MAENPSLDQIQTQLGSILEGRITDLMAAIKSAQGVSQQIALTDDQIRRQQMLKDQLETELYPLRKQAEDLSSETAALQQEVDSLLQSISKMRNLREELLAIKGGSARE